MPLLRCLMQSKFWLSRSLGFFVAPSDLFRTIG